MDKLGQQDGVVDFGKWVSYYKYNIVPLILCYQPEVRLDLMGDLAYVPSIISSPHFDDILQLWWRF